MTELHENAGSYALDALDEREQAVFEAHLDVCARCQGEVAEFCETAAELSLLTVAAPPADLRDSILDAIRYLPQVPPDEDRTVVRDLAPVSVLPTRTVPAGHGPRRAVPGSEVPEEPEEPQVDELAVRRQRRRQRALSGLVAAMLALAVGLGGVVYSLVQERQTQIATQRLEDELLRAPDAKIAVSSLEGGGRVTFIVSKELNRAQFIGTDLPDPGDRRYQLWTGKGDPTEEDGITGISRDLQVPERGGRVEAFFTGDVEESDFLAVNLEPAGSTPEQPTPPVLVAKKI